MPAPAAASRLSAGLPAIGLVLLLVLAPATGAVPLEELPDRDPSVGSASSPLEAVPAPVERLATGSGDRWEQGLALVHDVREAQRQMADDRARPDSPVDQPASLEQAVRELVAAYGAELTPGEEQKLEAAMQWPADLRDPLARLIHAHARSQQAVSEAPEPPALASPQTRGLERPKAVQADVDRALDTLASLASARIAFLEAAQDLDAALQSDPAAPAEPAAPRWLPLYLPPFLAIRLNERDTIYTEDIALVVDVGGNDVYNNNAGGSSLAGGSAWDASEETCDLIALRAAGSLVDLAGDDRYGDPQEPRGCGVNGGGWIGAGLLVDARGFDRYRGAAGGVNGGGALGGVGLLLDLGGSDWYNATDGGTNGGAGLAGVGALIDRDGSEIYNASDVGTNGGGEAGLGALVDASGAPRTASAVGNFSRLGHDLYRAGDHATNGGTEAGVGLLVDDLGDDTYLAGREGTNGGANFGGRSLLVDAQGSDRYEAGSRGTNGGGDWQGSGGLVDAVGHDEYIAGTRGTNGAAGWDEGCPFLCSLPTEPTGLLLDGAGNDRYQTPWWNTYDQTKWPYGGKTGARIDVPLPWVR